jgi:hypothetical protein
LVIAERVLLRLAEQDRAEAEAAALVAPAKVQVAGRAVLLIPHRGDAPDESVLPDDYRRILQIVRAGDGPVQVRAVGEELGLKVAVRGKLEPLRATDPETACPPHPTPCPAAPPPTPPP